jgi:hypothetical protein
VPGPARVGGGGAHRALSPCSPYRALAAVVPAPTVPADGRGWAADRSARNGCVVSGGPPFRGTSTDPRSHGSASSCSDVESVAVPPAGFEPAPRRLKGACSGPLSYRGEAERARVARGTTCHRRFSRPRPTPAIGWPLQAEGRGFEPRTRAGTRATPLPTTLLAHPDAFHIFPAFPELDSNQRSPPYQGDAVTGLGHRGMERRGWDSNPRRLFHQPHTLSRSAR